MKCSFLPSGAWIVQEHGSSRPEKPEKPEIPEKHSVFAQCRAERAGLN